MRQLFFLSDDWVGVRGDQSFTEAVSSDKPFFYDSRNHARYFIKDLTALAENRLRNNPSALHTLRMIRQASLWSLQEEGGDWVDENHFQQKDKMPWDEIGRQIGKALRQPSTLSGLKQFNQMIVQEHSFNDYLCNLVKRRLLHALCPQIQRVETQQVNLYLAGQLSFSQLIKSLNTRLCTIL